MNIGMRIQLENNEIMRWWENHCMYFLVVNFVLLEWDLMLISEINQLFAAISIDDWNRPNRSRVTNTFFQFIFLSIMMMCCSTNSIWIVLCPMMGAEKSGTIHSFKLIACKQRLIQAERKQSPDDRDSWFTASNDQSNRWLIMYFVSQHWFTDNRTFVWFGHFQQASKRLVDALFANNLLPSLSNHFISFSVFGQQLVNEFWNMHNSGSNDGIWLCKRMNY